MKISNPRFNVAQLVLLSLFCSVVLSIPTPTVQHYGGESTAYNADNINHIHVDLGQIVQDVANLRQQGDNGESSLIELRNTNTGKSNHFLTNL